MLGIGILGVILALLSITFDVSLGKESKDPQKLSDESVLSRLNEEIDKRSASILDYDTTDCLPNAINKFKLHVKHTSEDLLSYAELYMAASSDMADLISKFRHFHLSQSMYQNNSKSVKAFRALSRKSNGSKLRIGKALIHFNKKSKKH